MEIYRNLGGDSNVHAFEIGPDWILVEFNGGAQYIYTYASAGPGNIETAKSLARAGQGLNGYIQSNMRKLYERRVQ